MVTLVKGNKKAQVSREEAISYLGRKANDSCGINKDLYIDLLMAIYRGSTYIIIN